MPNIHNAFEPGELKLAQTIFDHVWASLPADVRNGARGPQLREWLAKQVLASIKRGNAGAEGIQSALLMRTDMLAWS